ncbi:MAG: hypothetical protein EOP60_10110 [Sphingomonadales bacterium]|nr:MAG: hypothetical protein EOP60_10110 [Sphingomonadales bacterium]
MSKHSPRETFARPLGRAPESLQPADLPQPAPPEAGALAVQPPPGADAAPGTALATTIEEETSLTPYLDDNGFDPAEYDWVPVRRRPRADGWSEAKQRAFIEVLADTGQVDAAAQHVGMTPQSCYRLRRSPGAEAFAAAWNAAIHQASLKLVDVAFERAFNGSDEPVFDRDGRRVGRRMKTNDRLLMFLMRAHMPDRYRHAHMSNRHPSEPPAPPSIPVSQALSTLEPVMPPEPHALLALEDLDCAIEVADLLDGKLPPWRRDPDDRAYDVPVDPHALSPELEAALEAIKQAGAPPGYRPPGEDSD